MLDLSYFKTQNSDVQGFFSGGTWQTWIKPRGAKLVNILCQGSGGGGGGGFQDPGTRSGGSGGGSGATAKLTIDANLLPDILYVLPGIGGIGGFGGAPATAGSPGQSSFVTLVPSTSSASNIILRSGTVVAAGGAGGTSAIPTQAAGETINVIANNIFANLGTFTYQAGITSNSASLTNSAATTPANFVSNSGGGGGTSTSGGVSGSGVFPSVPTTPVNANGPDGPIYYKPTLILYGGRGGGGAATGNGGNGGNGAPGCGGGGGGASANVGVNAGNGGRGGDGFVIITTSI
ncbi:MAG: glycine-rich domain-containing protein [Dolichospermum sp.]